MNVEQCEKSGLIASDTCLLCGVHCGHSYKGSEVSIPTKFRYCIIAVKDSQNGDYIFFDTCNNPVWICSECAKKVLEREKKRRKI